MQLRVHSWETLGVHDGPGIRLVVFLQGCNLQCLYCHNPDTQSGKGGQQMSVDEIMKILEGQRPYLSRGGLTVSGGEPTLQAAPLVELFTRARAAGIHTVLDTNGTVEGTKIQELYSLTDLLLLDVKHINVEHHRKLTGRTNEAVLRNAALRERQKKPMWLRYVLVPGLTDQPEFLHAWGRHFQNFTSIERVEILPYHTLGVRKYAGLGRCYPLENTVPPTEEEILAAQSILQLYLPHTRVCAA